MSVATHLQLSPDQYDAKIRTLIPRYDELIAEAAQALHLAARPIATLVDLGVGTGALALACLGEVPRARIVGIDTDVAMMKMETRMLERAGFAVDVPWRRSPFAVVAGLKTASG